MTAVAPPREPADAPAPVRRRGLRGRRGRTDPVPVWLWVAGVVVAVYLVLPTLIVIPMSFSEATTFVFPPKGNSLWLYRNFFTNDRWLDALRNSLIVAVLAAGLATVVGTAAALGLDQLRGRVARLVRSALMFPILTPSIVIATAVYISFLRWHLTGTLTGYVLAHAALASPLVLVSVTSALATFDATYLRASASLGASPWRAFVTVTLPLISRGVATGAVLAFVTSFDEVVIALFLRSPKFQTLPVQMYNSVVVDIDPTIAASSSLIVVTVSLIFLVALLAGARKRR
ncbi:ABC transporter permease [Dactylosporangium sp. NPDC005572]|uniref:ABC transporter permease n=1 Tax=Dactylosporangium sp. NPDC005572 TaxID=3156889 RepID=UPI0033AED874